MCAPVAIFMVSQGWPAGQGGRLHQLKLHQSEIVRVLAETTPGRPRLGLEKTGEPIRAAPLQFSCLHSEFFMFYERRNEKFAEICHFLLTLLPSKLSRICG